MLKWFPIFSFPQHHRCFHFFYFHVELSWPCIAERNASKTCLSWKLLLRLLWAHQQPQYIDVGQIPRAAQLCFYFSWEKMLRWLLVEDWWNRSAHSLSWWSKHPTYRGLVFATAAADSSPTHGPMLHVISNLVPFHVNKLSYQLKAIKPWKMSLEKEHVTTDEARWHEKKHWL